MVNFERKFVALGFDGITIRLNKSREIFNVYTSENELF
jgi:hypothetical protein